MPARSIPVLDIGRLWSPETLDALDHACREWGFFQVTNHGIADSVLLDLFSAMQDFFSLPGPEKRELERTAVNPWGYYDRELTRNTLDWKQVYDYGPADGNHIRPQWPRSLPSFGTAIRAYYESCERLSRDLVRAVSKNLGMPRYYLDGCFDERHTSFLRLNHYPVCPRPARPDGLTPSGDGHLGINHHTDAGALTILLQDQQPGLEVYRHGEWHLVEPRRDALVVNVGDIIQVWSNDLYKASLHRVTVSVDQPRYSAPFFFNPAYQTNYMPLPSTVSGSRSARYRVINWGEFRAGRAAGDYADLGEEIQISQFRNPAGRNDAMH